jgi:hypothetical protein
MHNLNVALALAAAGISIFPAVVKEKKDRSGWDKIPAVRKGQNWREIATTDQNQIQAWWLGRPACVPGIPLGRIGLVALDPDRHQGMDAPDGMTNFADLARTLDDIPLHPVTTTAGGGEHHIFRQPPGQPIGNGEGNLPEGINVRGVGGWLVAPGAMRPDGALWQTKPGTPSLIEAFLNGSIPVIPGSLAAIISQPSEKRRPSNGKIRRMPDVSPDDGDLFGKPPPAYLRHTIDYDFTARLAASLTEGTWEECTPANEARLRSALSLIPAKDREVWSRVGMALHSTSWSNAFDIWDAWSRTCPDKYDEADQQKTWKSFGRRRDGPTITIATIFHMAKQRGWTGDGARDPKVHLGPPHQRETKKPEPKAQSNGTAPEGALKPPASSGDAELDAEIKRLLGLPPALYERGRKDASVRFSIRTSVIDKLVAAARCGDNKEGLQGKSLKLFEPEAWPEAVNGVELLDDVRRMLRDYVWMTEAEADAVTLWCVHTYCFDFFPCTPRLAILSPTPECGKSTALEIISRLVPRALSTADVTPAAVFRTIEQSKPVLLIDEAKISGAVIPRSVFTQARSFATHRPSTMGSTAP